VDVNDPITIASPPEAGMSAMPAMPAMPPLAPSSDATPDKSAPRGGVFSALRHRNYALLFIGQLVSVLGDQVYGLALPWTVLTVTGDARKMAVVLAAGAVPRVLLLLVGGALADRLNPRVVMLGADLGRAVVVGVLGVTLFFGLPPLWIVAVLAGLEGAGTGLFGPGVTALIPRILPEDALPSGNGLFQVVQYSTLAIGPVLGGVATAAQATLAFLADAASFAVSALALAAMRLPRKAATVAPAAAATDATSAAANPPAAAPARKGLFTEIGDGLRYTFHQPLIRSTMLVTIFGNLGFSGMFGVALIVLSRALSPSAVTLGVLLAAVGVGGVLGGLSAGLLSRVPHRGVVGLALFGVSAILCLIVPFVAGPAGKLPFVPPLDFGLDAQSRIIAIAALLGVVGIILTLGDTMFITVMQQRIAPEYMARVFSAQFVAGGITQPLSLVAAGYLSAVYGPGIVFIVGGACLLIGILVGFSSRELRRM
jgi:hypothetical protein